MTEEMTKARLLDLLRAARAEWDALLAQIPPDKMTQPGVGGHWSVKDNIAHMAHFERWHANRIDEALHGVRYTPTPFNGLITNDKFCMSRAVRLKLTWSRRPLRLRRPSTGESTYPLNENNRCGGADETPMANSSKSAAETGRATPMGPSLPTPSAMGSDGFTGNGQSTDSVFPATSGGVS